MVAELWTRSRRRTDFVPLHLDLKARSVTSPCRHVSGIGSRIKQTSRRTRMLLLVVLPHDLTDVYVLICSYYYVPEVMRYACNWKPEASATSRLLSSRP